MSTNKKNWTTFFGVLLAPVLVYYSLMQAPREENPIPSLTVPDTLTGHFEKSAGGKTAFIPRLFGKAEAKVFATDVSSAERQAYEWDQWH